MKRKTLNLVGLIALLMGSEQQALAEYLPSMYVQVTCPDETPAGWCPPFPEISVSFSNVTTLPNPTDSTVQIAMSLVTKGNYNESSGLWKSYGNSLFYFTPPSNGEIKVSFNTGSSTLEATCTGSIPAPSCLEYTSPYVSVVYINLIPSSHPTCTYKLGLDCLPPQEGGKLRKK